MVRKWRSIRRGRGTEQRLLVESNLECGLFAGEAREDLSEDRLWTTCMALNRRFWQKSSGCVVVSSDWPQ